jgi:hypothetical protein
MSNYQPAWMRLGEAVAYLERSRSMSPQAAKEWLLRAMQDVLRGDRIRYPQQNMFRVQGYPMRWTRRGSPDWPMQLTPAELNWDQSTVVGQHPVRIIDVDLLIEVSAAALLPDAGGIHLAAAATPSGVQTNKQAALKGQCSAWIRTLPTRPPRRKSDVKADAVAAISGLSGRQFDAAWDEAAPPEWKRAGRRSEN